MNAPQLPQLILRQRVAVLLGCLMLLACILYPEVETRYYRWVNDTPPLTEQNWEDAVPVGKLRVSPERFLKENGYLGYWLPLRSTRHREFILNAEHGHVVHPDIFGDPVARELMGLIERRTAVKFANVLLQAIAVLLMTAGATWALKE